MQEHSRWGPPDGLSNLYVTGEQKFGFQKHERKMAFFENSKTFIVRMGCGWVGVDQKGPSIFANFQE